MLVSRTPAFLVPTLLLCSAVAHAQDCQEDSDCAANEECLLDDVDVADCPPNQDCEAVEVDAHGSCSPKAATCSDDEDCPQPAHCGEDGECVLRVEACVNDSACAPGYVCTNLASTTCESVDVGDVGDGTADPKDGGSADLGEREVADSGDIAQDPKAAPDAGPEAADLLPPDEQPPGTPNEPELVCFPSVQTCDDDSDCEADWVCAEIPDGGPGEWADVDSACLPPGLVAAIDGRIDVEGGSSTGEDSSSGGEDDITQEEPETIDDDDVVADDSVGLGTQGGSEGSSGCNANARSPIGVSPWWLLAIGVVFAGMRRRRR